MTPQNKIKRNTKDATIEYMIGNSVNVAEHMTIIIYILNAVLSHLRNEWLICWKRFVLLGKHTFKSASICFAEILTCTFWLSFFFRMMHFSLHHFNVHFQWKTLIMCALSKNLPIHFIFLNNLVIRGMQFAKVYFSINRWANWNDN